MCGEEGWGVACEVCVGRRVGVGVACEVCGE